MFTGVLLSLACVCECVVCSSFSYDGHLMHIIVGCCLVCILTSCECVSVRVLSVVVDLLVLLCAVCICLFHRRFVRLLHM